MYKANTFFPIKKKKGGGERGLSKDENATRPSTQIHSRALEHRSSVPTTHVTLGRATGFSSRWQSQQSPVRAASTAASHCNGSENQTGNSAAGTSCVTGHTVSLVL